MEIIKVIFIFATFCLISVLGQQGYEVKHFSDCRSAGLCCEQVNNTCYVPNARKVDGSIGNCFCDSKCLQMKDCCVDFEETCRGVYNEIILIETYFSFLSPVRRDGYQTGNSWWFLFSIRALNSKSISANSVVCTKLLRVYWGCVFETLLSCGGWKVRLGFLQGLHLDRIHVTTCILWH